MKTTKQMLSRLLVITSLILLTCALLATSAKTEEAAKESEAKGSEKADQKEKKEEPAPSGVGAGKAITQATVKDGMRLSDEALKSMGIKMTAIPTVRGEVAQIPAKSVLYYQADTGVYRVRDGWFKLIEGKVISKGASEVSFQAKDLKDGDQVVTDGAAVLRLGELNIWSGAGDAD